MTSVLAFAFYMANLVTAALLMLSLLVLPRTPARLRANVLPWTNKVPWLVVAGLCFLRAGLAFYNATSLRNAINSDKDHGHSDLYNSKHVRMLLSQRDMHIALSLGVYLLYAAPGAASGAAAVLPGTRCCCCCSRCSHSPHPPPSQGPGARPGAHRAAFGITAEQGAKPADVLAAQGRTGAAGQAARAACCPARAYGPARSGPVKRGAPQSHPRSPNPSRAGPCD